MLKRSIVLFLLFAFLCLNASACGAVPSQTGASSPTGSSTTPVSGVSPTPSLTPNGTSTPLQFAGAAISMNPNNFGTIACGTTLNIVFNAQISIAPGGSGQVAYTWNIDHTSIPGNVTFNTGQTSQTVTYTLSNISIQLNSASNVSGSITATSSGAAPVSANVAPTGTCRLPGPFQVVNIAMSVNPSSVSSVVCGTSVNITYSATVIIAADSNAGVVSLVWNTNPGHTGTSISFAPTQTTATISITLSEISSKHTTFPRPVSMTATAPNTFNSNSIQPSGQCHN